MSHRVKSEKEKQISHINVYMWNLAWKIPWTEEPGGLHSMGSLKVGHD